MTSPLLEPVLIVAFAYVLPIIHVLRSPRTLPGMRVLWCGLIVVFSLFGYMIWWLMTTSKAPPKLDPATLPAFPATPDAQNTTLYLLRWGFFGRANTFNVCIDDRTAAPIPFRGKCWRAIDATPGSHTLLVQLGVRWLEFPFDAVPGASLAFSLNAYAESPMSPPGLEGWLDDTTARYFLARLPRRA